MRLFLPLLLAAGGLQGCQQNRHPTIRGNMVFIKSGGVVTGTRLPEESYRYPGV